MLLIYVRNIYKFARGCVWAKRYMYIYKIFIYMYTHIYKIYIYMQKIFIHVENIPKYVYI